MRSRSASKGSSRKLAPLRGLGKTSFANVKKSKAPLTKGWVDEEIESESDDSADERVTEKKKGKPGSSNEMEDGDSEEIDDLEELNETADQKRRRLAMSYLEKVQMNSNMDDSAVAQTLQTDREKAQGKYYRNFDFSKLSNETIKISSFGGHKLAVTCVALTTDESTVYSGSKDNAVIKHDVETGARMVLKPHWSSNSSSGSVTGGGKSSTNNSTSQSVGVVGSVPRPPASAGEIFAIAVSSDGKYCVSGGKDKIIRVYDSRLKIPEIKTFTGHRDTVTSLTFRHSSYILYSGALDRTLKHWDLNDMAYMETMFGHQEGILAMDCGGKSRPVTVGGDRTARVWSIEDENHTLFRTKSTSLDCVQYLNDDEFATGGQDGSINIWRSSMKKPILFSQKTHGIESLSPRWVCSLASLKMSNLLLSGSYDGTIKFWDLAIDTAHYKNSTMSVAFELPVRGFINSLQVSNSGRLVVAGVGKEHKMGRWWNIKEAKNHVLIARLPDQNF